MKVLIPIYPNCLSEESLLKHPINGLPLALHAVRELCLIPNAEIHVFTKEDSTDDYSLYPVHHHRQALTGKQSQQYTHLPVGAMESIDYVSQHTKNPGEKVLIVDYRATNLTIDLIKKAYRFYMVSPHLPLLSVSATRDNPAQFLSYFRIIASDVLSIIENENHLRIDSTAIQRFFTGEGSFYFTKSVPFNWAPYGYPGEMRLKEFFVRLTTDKGYSFIPFEKFNTIELSLDYCPELYYKENPEKARRILQLKSLLTVNNSNTHAVSAVRGNGKSLFLLTNSEEEQSHPLFLHERCWDEFDIEIRLQPFFMDLPAAEEHYETKVYKVPEQRPECSINWQNSLYYGPVCIVESYKQQPDGFIVSALSRHISDNADFSEPVDLSDFCSSSSDGLRKINKVTGQEITGRQSSPDFLEINSTFIFSRLKDLPNIEQKMVTGKTRGFKFDCIQIRSEFDLLCLNNTQLEGCANVS